MENVIGQIFAGKVDELRHIEFVKFGKGTFTNKYLVTGKKQASKWSIKTGSEFANFFVRNCLEKISGSVKVKGAIIATFKIGEDAGFPIERIKQFMGIKQAIINTEVDPKKIIELMDKYPKAFFALSFSTDDCDLKIKAKAPKSAKPSAKGEKAPKPGFCSLKTTDKNIIDSLFFDVTDFKEIEINHTININQIILPKGESDPVKIRELAKRKGKLIRKITVDGKEKVSEKEFLV